MSRCSMLPVSREEKQDLARVINRSVQLHCDLAVDPQNSITYETEALRQTWVASDVHQVVWPTLQSYLTSSDFDFLLFEVI